ncbi:MAG: N-6 DNA methylase [Micropruina sp.]|nr:N-6 DNA methylase [Micropruina sp.]
MTASPLTLDAKNQGEVFTRRWVVEFMLDLVGYQPHADLASLTVVEPAVGSGAFWGALLDRLLESRPGRMSWEALADSLRGYDIQQPNVETCRAMSVDRLVDAGCPNDTAERLASRWLRQADFLFVNHDRQADLVVGNPPYIRIEGLESSLLANYRQVAPTMSGRADIFVGFYEHGLDLLKPGGRLAYICADRWMRNAYGRDLRAKVVRGFSVDDVIVMHDADAFEAEVSAYPAITVISRKSQGPATAARARATFGQKAGRHYREWKVSAEATLFTDDVEAAVLPSWHDTDDVWPDGSPAVQAWLERLEETLPLLESRLTGTKLGIGVATGADNVYVRRDLPNVEADRLMPMVTANAIRSGVFQFTGEHLISPWKSDGVVSLTDYPKLGRYYVASGEQLRGRSVAKRSGARWYRTIDRVNFALLEREMLVMQDMKAEAHPVRVPAGFVPHHNLYWIISDKWDLDALGGLLLSKVVEKQVESYCVKMRGGTLRFQAQVLRKVRVPQPSDISLDVTAALADAFRRRDRDAATRAALRAFNLDSLPV